jgi:hypothetical protein
MEIYDEIWLNISDYERVKSQRSYWNWRANRNLDILVQKIMDETRKKKLCS